MINGTQLETIRVTLGISKESLAKELKISRPTLNTKLADPNQFTREQMLALAKVLKIEISNFYV